MKNVFVLQAALVETDNLVAKAVEIHEEGIGQYSRDRLRKDE